MSDDWDDDEFDDEDDWDDDDDGVEDYHYVCPLCGADVWDEADICPACGDFIQPVLVERSSLRPMWYIFLGMAGILAVLLVLSGLIRFLG
mgnify:CR=1 FL=1